MAEKPENFQERLYNISNLNIWFAISSLIFFAVLIWSFVDDYSRSWKDYQRDFRALQIEKTNEEFEKASKLYEGTAEYKDIQKRLTNFKELYNKKSEAISRVEEELLKKDAILYRVQQEFNFIKANYDAIKYEFEEEGTHHLSEANELEEKLGKIHTEMLENQLVLEAAQDDYDEQSALVKQFSKEINEVKAEKGKLTKEATLIERKLTNLDPVHMDFSNKIGNIIRDLPFVDFLSPYYKVEQVVVNDITDNVNFTRVPKVDRCMTCHKGILDQEFESDTQPFKAHPRLDLYLSSTSPHPVEEFGCTSCHGGRGRGTDFISTVHVPSSHEQAKEWEEKYNWHQLHHWDTPMLPSQYIEASCFKCHSSETSIKNAERLNLGLNLIERTGCFGCHKIEKYKDRDKIGPNLGKLASKVTKEWAYNWINDPKSFRHNTWMPRFFNQPNNNDPDSQKRSEQEIHSIVHYLFEHSTDFRMDTRPLEGDIQKGEILVSSLGCFGCHRIESDLNQSKTTIETLRRDHGPNLIGIGSKTTADWVYTWLKDPQKYSRDTKMPNLRLSHQEAADIASYLSSLTKEGFSEKNIPSIDEKVLDEITLDFLKKMNSDKDSRIKRGEMTFEEKLDYNGEKLIRMYGCFGCHDIPGFENDKPIGTELTFEGSKLIEKLDFGFIEIPHSREAWFTQKLKEPRIFDRGKVKLPDEKLRMPNYDFTDNEIAAIVTALIGFVKDEIPESKIPERNERNIAIEAGEELIRIYNCLGCHIIDDKGGAIRPTIATWLGDIAGASSAEDASLIQSFSPPILDTEGRKVQPEWLFNFLNHPTMIRPNLQVRMPTYAMISDEDWNKIIKYFQLKDGQTLAYENPHQISKSSSSYRAGDVIQDLGACNNCHFYGSTKPKQAALTWAPNLSLTKERLRSEWVLDWLRDPQAIIPGTNMPTPYVPFDEQIEDVKSAWGKDVAKLHPDSEAMLKALRDYLWGIEGQQDVSAIVKRHLETEGYGFIVEDEEDDW